jgi:uncharacterized protein (DUF1330 family)
MTVYALNLFNVADGEEYVAYSRRSAADVAAHGGKVVALGKFRDALVGDIWHLFDRLDDLRPLLKLDS